MDKIQINGYDINQPFRHIKYTTVKGNCALIIDHIDEYDYMEYAFVVFDADDTLLDISLGLQVNGRDLYSRDGYLFHNKILPLEYENSFDVETNTVLKQMVRTDVKNIFFMPINIRTAVRNIMTLRIYNIQVCSNIDIYIKLGNEPHRNHLLYTYCPDKIFVSEMMEQYFNGVSGYAKYSSCDVIRVNELITNFYIDMVQVKNKQRIKNYHRLYDKISIAWMGSEISAIPFSYVELYLKVVENISLDNLTDANNHHVIPINLGQLINVPVIPIHSYWDLKLRIIPNSIDIFHHQIQKNVKCDIYSIYNYLPKEIWNVIAEYLNCRSLLNMMQSCKFFYSLVPQKRIEDLYDEIKINIDDLDLEDLTVKIMYHTGLDFLTKFKPEMDREWVVDRVRSVVQYKVVSMNNEYLLQINNSNPVEWIIIEFDHARIIEHVQFMPTDIDIMIPDTDFYLRMHNPPHRYVFYPSMSIECEHIHFKFGENSDTKINIYVAHYIQVTF